ncbi:DUF6525 family protein [Ruegeria sp. ANG-S4]|uniref:DUF6525 family protein n=1 Tax=Ruegeria sp. ANG-S4 TaxID=1577904 RepID=UPI0009E1E49D|nr:DUF6525 family protein [Ruegeria sp. ANG-S4]
MIRRNLRTSMKTRRRGGSRMRAFDALPRDLRLWLASACLPWSPESALKVWSRAGGPRNPDAAILRLEEIERAMLQKDAHVWQAKARQNG